ncbi:KPN_02809 family neutral zinc metallopeptidase [Planctomicrobium sp. SH664]|uniref:KPN_02809 family neutral zinc metallopeptidase n=1 Tax=Planctomicrobium sp. SH664 TaxID=3448125 RepID=UPI003F5B3419
MVQWTSGRRSENVEDRRSMGGRGMAIGGGGGLLMVVLILFLTGGDLGKALQFFLQNQVAVQQAPDQGTQPQDPQEESLFEFARVILADTEDVWGQVFAQQLKSRYQPPVMVFFRDRVVSGCGPATAAAGPFYCPADGKLYLDLSFYRDLDEKLGAPGDFAQAYVIAHEVGHHVQNLLGTSQKVQQMRNQLSEAEYNRLSVMLELQADFYAGVWAHYADKQRKIIEAGDIEEGINAAAAIGDDTLQKRQRGYADQESFTHGSSAQRVKWFRKGYETGDMRQGDTFNAPDL